MKKIVNALFAAVIVLCAALPARAADKQSYTFGVFWNAGTRQNASYSMMAKDITKAFTLTQGIQLSNLFYNDVDLFHDAITERKVDFIYANTEDDFLLGIMYGYKPFASISIFGKDKAASCLYVRADSDITDVSGLAGKSLITYPHQVAYSLLRKLLNAPPEKTFASMAVSTDAYAEVDALAQGTTDAIFLVETNIDFFQQVNPGPVKKIKKLACADAYNFMPLMVAPDVPDTMLQSMEAFYMGLDKNPAMDKYRPFMKQVDLKVIPVTDKDYEPFFILYEFSLAQGWDKDFEQWLGTTMAAQ